jgi:proline iminopeptidase
LYAAEFPERVEAMVLIAPADALVMPAQHGEPGLFDAMRERLPADQQDAFDVYLEDYLDYRTIFSKSETELAALNAGFAKYYAAATGATAPQQSTPGGWMVHAMYFSIGLRHDYRDAPREVTAPVLAIHGADDLQPEPVSRVYADVLPNASFHVIKDADHFPFYTQAEKFAAVIGAFLDGLR